MSTIRPTLFSLLFLALASGCDDDAPVPLPRTPAPPEQAAAAPVDAGEKPLAQLISLEGEVRLEHGGKLSAAAEGPLWRGDVLETGADGEATVRFADGRTVEVGPEGRLVLGEDASGLVLELARGLVLSRLPATQAQEGQKVSLTILSPFGLTRLGSSESQVRVAVEEAASRVEVELGSVELVSKSGKRVQASAGQSFSVTSEQVTRRVLELAPVQVTVYASSGRTEWRQKGSARWRTVSGRGEALQAGDSVRVRRGEAQLRLEGSKSALALSEGGELVVEGVAQGDNTDETRLDLRQGELGLQLAQGRTSRVVLPGLALESDGAARVEVRRTQEGFTVDSRAGRVMLVRGESREPLQAGERASVGGSATRVESLQPAPLELVPREGQQVFHQRSEEVALTWEEKGEVQVEVATDAAFERLVLSGTTPRGFVNVPAPSRGSLHWRVRRADGSEAARGSARFAPERSLKGQLGLLRNLVPEGPQKTTILYQDKPPAVTFTCEPEPGAVSYRVAVYREGQLDKPLEERSASTPQVALGAGTLGEGSFLWSITPLSASGSALRGGRMSKLEIAFDNSVPSLIISAPREGQRAGARVLVSGVAPVGARLSVNGQPLPLDGKHRFSTWVAPVGQPPRVLFKMSRPGAPDVYTVRTLK